MRQTTPTAWNVRTSNTARHTAANRRKAILEEKRAEAVRKGIEARERRMGNKATLYRFQNTFFDNGTQTPPDGYFRISVVSWETGEIRKYYTKYAANIKYIGNTDYIVNGRERSTYYVHQYDSLSPNAGGINEIMVREAGVKGN